MCQFSAISADLKVLKFSASASYDELFEKKSKEDLNTIFQIDVKFAPLESLTSQSKGTGQIADSADEDEYLAQYKIAISNGKISKTERQLLETTRMRLGISKSRSKALENSVTLVIRSFLGKTLFVALIAIIVVLIAIIAYLIL